MEGITFEKYCREFTPYEEKRERELYIERVPVFLFRNGQLGFYEGVCDESSFEHKLLGYIVEDYSKTNFPDNLKISEVYNDIETKKFDVPTKIKKIYELVDMLPENIGFGVYLRCDDTGLYWYARENGILKYSEPRCDTIKVKSLKKLFSNLASHINVDNIEESTISFDMDIHPLSSDCIGYLKIAPVDSLFRPEGDTRVYNSLVNEILPQIKKSIDEYKDWIVDDTKIFTFKFVVQYSKESKQPAHKLNFWKKTFTADTKEDAEKQFYEFLANIKSIKTPGYSLGSWHHTYEVRDIDTYRKEISKDINKQIKYLQEELKKLDDTLSNEGNFTECLEEDLKRLERIGRHRNK